MSLKGDGHSSSWSNCDLKLAEIVCHDWPHVASIDSQNDSHGDSVEQKSSSSLEENGSHDCKGGG